MFCTEIDGFDYTNGEIRKLLKFQTKNKETLSTKEDFPQYRLLSQALKLTIYPKDFLSLLK